MFYKITDFIRAHKSAIRVVLGFALLIASLLLIINRHPFAGGIVVLVLGMVFATSAVSNSFMSYLAYYAVIAGLMLVSLL